MSGSGGGGYSGAFEQFNTCDTLIIDTQLSSPKEEVIDMINVGDLLEVAIQTVNSQAVVVVLYNGMVAGGIAAPQVQKLRECMSQGTRYNATVVSKNDGQVRIRIKPIQS
jgi:ribosomal protein S1